MCECTGNEPRSPESRLALMDGWMDVTHHGADHSPTLPVLMTSNPTRPGTSISAMSENRHRQDQDPSSLSQNRRISHAVIMLHNVHVFAAAVFEHCRVVSDSLPWSHACVGRLSIKRSTPGRLNWALHGPFSINGLLKQ